MATCFNCGREVSAATICPYCGWTIRRNKITGANYFPDTEKEILIDMGDVLWTSSQPVRMSIIFPNVVPETIIDEEKEVKEQHHLVLYNDDVNTFDHVIECLCEICGHEPEQAEQCAWIVHMNGRCSVKDGTYKKLSPLCEALLDRKLTAMIE